MPKVYFRSDTRSPEEIFEHGFSAREDKGDSWLFEAIQAGHYNDTQGLEGEPIDAVSNLCVCLTTKFESAAVFPIADEKDNKSDTSYVYAVVLPDAKQISYLGQKSVQFEKKDTKDNIITTSGEGVMISLERDENTPKDIKEIVLDLHSLQATQAGNIIEAELNKNEKLDSEIGLWVGGLLYAYEAIALKVLPQNIVGAIKVTREPEKPVEIISKDESKNLPTRVYSVENQIFENKNFKNEQKIECVGGTKSFDYSKLHTEALDTLKGAIVQHEIQSPDPYYGLGGKILPNPLSADLISIENSLKKDQSEITSSEPKWLQETAKIVKSFREKNMTEKKLAEEIGRIYVAANTQETKTNRAELDKLEERFKELADLLPACKKSYEERDVLIENFLKAQREEKTKLEVQMAKQQKEERVKAIPPGKMKEILNLISVLTKQEEKKEVSEKSRIKITLAKSFLSSYSKGEVDYAAFMKNISDNSSEFNKVPIKMGLFHKTVLLGDLIAKLKLAEPSLKIGQSAR